MAEIKCYSCDGGCGATTALDHPVDSLAVHGWSVTYTPTGYPTLFTCSLVCLMRACERLGARGSERTLPR